MFEIPNKDLTSAASDPYLKLTCGTFSYDGREQY